MSKKEVEKQTKKTVKKDVKNTKKVETKKEVKNKKEKQESFFTGVRKEMKKVRWPLKKEMVKYSIAVLSFIIFFALFFALADVVIAGIKMLVA